jgi:hypothetical protein
VDEPEFDAALPSLLDRGIVFAHAHIRGGGEMGRRWWRQGRLRSKATTFSDHIAVADALGERRPPLPLQDGFRDRDAASRQVACCKDGSTRGPTGGPARRRSRSSM